ncbi:hypothetical protein EMIHUDRAFT_236293 [Emiliania huxleyi CCMP1516]|uniref:CCZ1/INTU/HSP4 first Longin domain-containing protein n=2 Tax=Emiliania huxleyi TaxID=2903 RepID=A0A0D3JTP7_EMIH1|nr:hypothetical protein EMIHUDRAFT_236293 [Emiliania huxleyi CCMP1516]EOD26882.1 hypothetical protein EMIHUDRAFT_236293 [Emiliania huxleyi CCMP1516]|eukprot:XP_005779311.1 hypothetical protein EMIHUDRAFT_236293 [Emiliania huxleyi CCMP1516]
MSNAALQLEQLFIFHPRLGSEAGEKLLYFHPEHTPLAEQHNALGLVVALEGLLANFGVASPFELLATAQRRYVVLQPEPSLWLVAVHMLPPSAPAATARQRGAIEEEAEAEAADADAVRRAALEQLYETLRLCCGPFSRRLVESGGAASVRALLSGVMPRLLAVAALQHEAEGDFLTAVGGIQYLPLGQAAGLRCHAAMTAVLSAQPAAARCSPGTGGVHDVSPTLPGHVPQAHLLLTFEGRLLVLRAHRAKHAADASATPAAGFLVGAGAAGCGDGADGPTLPRLFVRKRAPLSPGQADPAASCVSAASSPPEAAAAGEGLAAGEASGEGRHERGGDGWEEDGWEGLRLAVLCSHGVGIALLLEDGSREWADRRWHATLRASLSSELEGLGAVFAEQARRAGAEEQSRRYVSFDSFSLALQLLERLLLRSWSDLEAGEARQVAARAAEGWLLARASGSRRLFALVESKHASLAEAHQEALALTASHLSHIFIDG